MKNKLRKIQVKGISFLWSVSNKKNSEGISLLRIWLKEPKKHLWITVDYPFHNPWAYLGELYAVQTPEEKTKTDHFFQFEPMTPQKVSTIINSAMEFFEGTNFDKLHMTYGEFNSDENGNLQCIKKTNYI